MNLTPPEKAAFERVRSFQQKQASARANFFCISVWLLLDLLEKYYWLVLLLGIGLVIMIVRFYYVPPHSKKEQAEHEIDLKIINSVALRYPEIYVALEAGLTPRYQRPLLWRVDQFLRGKGWREKN